MLLLTVCTPTDARVCMSRAWLTGRPAVFEPYLPLVWGANLLMGRRTQGRFFSLAVLGGGGMKLCCLVEVMAALYSCAK